MGQEEEAMEVDEEEREVEEEEMEGVGGADDTTTTTSCAGDDTTSGGKDGILQKKRQRNDVKDRNDRRLNQLVVDRHRITQVSASGQPLQPKETVRGYRLQLACIVRNV
jgi:hypothetical protein